MCFSPEVSFASAAALVPTGAYCLRAVARKVPRLWPLAVVPCVFGVQQVCEGFVWLGLRRGDDRLTAAAALAYQFFALAFWPVWFSVAAALIEPHPGRRRLLAGWAALATGWFWLAYLPLVLSPDPTTAYVHRHSVRYHHADDAIRDPPVRWGLRLLYVLTAAGPLVISSWRRVLVPPVALGVGSAAVAVVVYDHAFTSVWCLFAAVLSVSFAVALRAARPVPSAPPDPSARAAAADHPRRGMPMPRLPALAVLVVAVLALTGCRNKPAPDDAIDPAEAPAVAAVERLGGKVTRNEEFQGPKHVLGVFLGGTPATDGDLKALAPLRHVVWVDLRDTAVTDAGLKDVAALPNLTTLTVLGTKVTGTGLKDLAGLPKLKAVNLGRTPLTDEGLDGVLALRQITTLDLRGTRVTDAQVARLAGLSNLTGLNLAETPVTDAGVKPLAALTNLTALGLKGTPVTDTAVGELRQALPGCKITR